jgi:hypothetical protein
MSGRDFTLNREDYTFLARKHVLKGAEWGNTMGTDYWLQVNPGLDIAGAAATATGDELAENGWVATSLVNTAPSGADFGSSSDVGIPAHLLTNASSDLLSSPTIFGDYAHMHAASRIVGRSILPRRLIAEFWGSMSVNSADEVRSGWGFIEDGGTPATEADQQGFITSDSVNFQIAANAGTPINGTTTLDTAWHLFKIILDRTTGLITWAIDGVSQVMSTTLAITNDEFPLKFGFHAFTTNRPLLGLTHIYYDWNQR